MLQCFGIQFLTYLKVNTPSPNPQDYSLYPLHARTTWQGVKPRISSIQIQDYPETTQTVKHSSTSSVLWTWSFWEQSCRPADSDNRQKTTVWVYIHLLCFSKLGGGRGGCWVGPWGFLFFYFSGSLKGKHKVKNSLQAGIVEKHLEGSNHQCELIL